jgi:hypothetical protein
MTDFYGMCVCVCCSLSVCLSVKQSVTEPVSFRYCKSGIYDSSFIALGMKSMQRARLRPAQVAHGRNNQFVYDS